MNTMDRSSGAAPQRGVFYGWWVLTACLIGLAFGYSNAAYLSFGLFVLPLTETFGWGRDDFLTARPL